MKTYLFTLILFMTVSLSGYAQNSQPLKGSWGGKDFRSLAPEAPKVFIDGDILSINLQDPLTNLSITIFDENGGIVYQDVITSTEINYTKYILLNYPMGNYRITFSHELGYLYGDIKIE